MWIEGISKERKWAQYKKQDLILKFLFLIQIPFQLSQPITILSTQTWRHFYLLNAIIANWSKAYEIKTKEHAAKINNGKFAVNKKAFGESTILWIEPKFANNEQYTVWCTCLRQPGAINNKENKKFHLVSSHVHFLFALGFLTSGHSRTR